MPEHLTPGVYVEEIDRGPRPIEGVPTSTAAFLGETERGPLRPHLVTSYSEYRRCFGGVFRSGCYMPHAVRGFFENGGRRLFVSRVVGERATTASKVFGDFTVRAVGPGAWGRRVWVAIRAASTNDASGASTYRLMLAYWASLPEDFLPFDPFDPACAAKLPRPQYQESFDDLSVDPNSPDYFEKRLIDRTTNEPVSALAAITRTNQGTNTKPEPTVLEGEFLDEGGADDVQPLGRDHFVGDKGGGPEGLQGLRALEGAHFREVALVYAPHPLDNQVDIAKAVIDHCERMQFRFGVIDPTPQTEPADLDPRTAIQETEHAAFYAPWIFANDPETGARGSVPPGGHVLGVYARSDVERGVFKSPANEVLHGALDPLFDIDDAQQAIMNPRGINAIRRFPGRGIRVWGARTLSTNSLWKYVPVRRLFIFLERSIYEGTQWAIFEPNDDRLWARVKDVIRLFLRSQWRAGALFGATEDEAFFVTCDRTTMTQDDILNGRLVCEVGIAPVRPADFVIFRISQQTAEAQQ